MSPNFVSQNRSWGEGGIVGNRVANFRKNGVGGTTISDGRVYCVITMMSDFAQIFQK